MDWLDRIASVRRWEQNGYRAPHKPLLLLYALGHHQRHGAAPIEYGEAEKDLARLLKEFGPPRRTTPAYPFHHLATDGFWTVTTAEGGTSPAASPAALRRAGARGSLTPGLAHALDTEPGLLDRIARYLLDANFEPSLHAEIRMLAGLSPDGGAAGHRADPRLEGGRRDPGFRDEVLTAYEHRCAFCGYEGWIDGLTVGLEAAHVRWWALGGPDDTGNGLCLCSIHHRLFDRGVLGLTEDRAVTVSTRFVGRSASTGHVVHALAGRRAHDPQPGYAPVAADHIAWHRREVFRGRPRERAAATAEPDTGA
jgi:putative restriction endonuclease